MRMGEAVLGGQRAEAAAFEIDRVREEEKLRREKEETAERLRIGVFRAPSWILVVDLCAAELEVEKEEIRSNADETVNRLNASIKLLTDKLAATEPEKTMALCSKESDMEMRLRELRDKLESLRTINASLFHERDLLRRQVDAIRLVRMSYC